MLNNIMASWGNSIVHQTKLAQEHLANFFSYEYKMFNSLKEVIIFLSTKQLYLS